MRGRFITFEGGEGAGKSTQISRLSAYLSQERGIEVVATREPGGCPSAEDIRDLLVKGDGGRWDPTSEALLHYVARREHIMGKVGPALKRGCWVLSDRFSDSTKAYQGHGQELGARRIADIEALVLGDLPEHLSRPDLTLILDLPVEQGLARAKGRAGDEDRYEGLALAFHDRVRQAFLGIAEAEPDRCRVIDASGSADDVESAVRKAVIDQFRKTLA